MNRSEIPTVQDLVVIQRNPVSGSGKGRHELLRLIRELRCLGFRVRMFSSRPGLDAYLRSNTVLEKLVCIVAAGGDGTVADLVNRHPGIPIAILPLGTENLLAHFLGIRRCGRSLAGIIQRGRQQVMDSALANGRRFLLMLSVGVDAEIVDALHAARKGNIHRIRYVWPTLRAFLKSVPKTFRATSNDDDSSITGTHLIVTNVSRYGFGLSFSPDALPDDGLLEVRAFLGNSRWHIFWHAVRLKLGLKTHDHEVARFSASSVCINCLSSPSRGLSQCDGDPGPTLPLQVVIDPLSLTLIVP